jgi:ribosomal protein S18 acetylase RimI-like enzyme
VTDLTTRAATPADARAIAEAHVQGWRWAYRGHIPSSFLESLDVDGREMVWRERLSEKNSEVRVWVAEREGKVVGFVCTGLPQTSGAANATMYEDGTAELQAMYLVEDAAGKGAGRALIIRALADLRQRGYESVILWVLEENERARKFYEKAGFHLDGAKKDDPREGFTMHEVRYRANLA